MNWTTTPPAAEGYYWMRVPGEEPEVVAVWPFFHPGEFAVWRFGVDGEGSFPAGAEWWGPLPLPPQSHPEETP